MKKVKRVKKILMILFALMLLGTAVAEEENTVNDQNLAQFPQALEQVPDAYYTPMTEQQGTLENLYYDTYEAFTYTEKTQKLQKRAVIYLPYGYSEDQQYDVLYLMHGGWSDETVYMGEPGSPRYFKHVLDHAIADGRIRPIIVVAPTYNNTSPEDSGDYSLAIQLTDLYHQELENDLIPAVEGKYSTYAANTTAEGLIAARDHRMFAGFSMGSVTTWRTFQHSLDYFRYFMPSSGNMGTNGQWWADTVRASGHEWDDFFIFAASGTDDFAYSSFKYQIQAMAAVSDGTFRYGPNEQNSNLFYLEQEGGTHSGPYAMQYFYNGLLGIRPNNEI